MPSASADSVRLFGFLDQSYNFNGRFQGQAGPPQVMRCFKTLTQN